MSTQANPRQRGVIVKWITEKKYGFIRPHAGGPDLFTHASQLRRIPGIEHQSPLIGTLVEFCVITTPQGRPIAADVYQPHVRVVGAYVVSNRDEVSNEPRR
jgi:cold shock CspA family protein